MKKSILIKIISLTLILAFSFQFSQAASVTELNNQLQQKQQALDASQSAAANKALEAQSLSKQINNLDADIKSTEQKIAETGNQIGGVQTTIDSLSSSIDLQNQQLTIIKQKLNSALVEIYRFSNKSDWQLIFNNETLGNESNQAKYVQAVEIQVKSLFTQVETAKQELEKQKKDQEAKKQELSDLQNQQATYKKGAEYQKTQKDKLLGMTIQQKASYEEQAKKLKSEIASISAEIYKQRQGAKKGGTIRGGGSAYDPMSGSDDVDAWRFVPYQCTSYAAWYWNIKLGKPWENTRVGSGSAYNWPNLARDQGYSVSGTPRVGAIISWQQGLYKGDLWGHVAIVEKVNSNGTIDVSEYNYAYKESYSYRSGINPADEGVGYSYIY